MGQTYRYPLLALAEALFVFTSAFWITWVLSIFIARPYLVKIAIGVLAMMIVSHVIRKENPLAFGFGISGFVPTLANWLPAIFGICTCALFIGYGLNRIKPDTVAAGLEKFFHDYLIWALFQQYVLCGFLAQRLRIFFEGKSENGVIIISAAMFSLIHFPNPTLMIVCFFFGLIAVSTYFSYKNLYALAILHSLIGTTLFLLQFPMRVGPGYFR